MQTMEFSRIFWSAHFIALASRSEAALATRQAGCADRLCQFVFCVFFVAFLLEIVIT
jgi:hypothetical protein